MRTLLIVSAGVALAGAGAADAQRVVTRGPGAAYPMPGRAPMVHPVPGTPPMIRPMPARPGVGPHVGSRWGSRVGGRWWGGMNAPGGWQAYRRPVRGYVLPTYWVAPRFYVNDWQAYGLAAPSTGHTWVRYYDDAVLIDQRGSVYDTAHGIDWDRDGRGYDADETYADAEVHHGHGGADRADDGLGGAAVGAVVGGVAGNVIAGRGNRLGGTLVGAGVGAAAGYAIDKAEDRRQRRYRRERAPLPPIAPDYGPGYPDGPPPPPPPPHAYGHGYGAPTWVSPDGRTTVVTTGGGYGASTTTVVVQSAPVITTTTTEEVIEDHVTYTRKPRWTKPTKIIRRRAAKPRCVCR